VCFDFLYNFVRKFSDSKTKSAIYYYKCILVSFSLCLSGFNKTLIFSTDIQVTLKVHENTPSENRFLLSRRDAHTDTTKQSLFAILQTRQKWKGRNGRYNISRQQHEQKRVSVCAQEVLRVTSALTLKNSVFQRAMYVCVRMILTLHTYFSPNQH
jgi:hypothetical protein